MMDRSVLLFLMIAGIAGIFVLRACRPASSPAFDTLIIRAKVWTYGIKEPYDAVGIIGDTISALGFYRELADRQDEHTVVIDAEGGFLCPGFIDSHVHFLEGGANLSSVQLRDAASKETFIRRIAEFVGTVPAGTWVTGGDWNHELWGGDLPDRTWIDSVTADHPLMINRLDGHMVLVNTKAMELAGVDGSIQEVPGGEIVRDATGRLTGVFKDNAASVFYQALPVSTLEQEDRALDAAMRYVNSHGVTSVHHMGSFADLEVFERNWQKGRLTTRIYAATPLGQWASLKEKTDRDGRGDKWLHWGGLKGFVDGSLGSHTGAFWAPFTDVPTDSGLLVTETADLEKWIMEADRVGLQVMVHAIGDRANSILLDIYEKTAAQNGMRDRRFRIEHAQHLRPADIPRFGTLGVIPSMQPYHAIDDGCWAEKVIGPERIKTTYAFRSLLDAGARVAFGSDWFVAPPIPLEGIYAAVARQTLDGKHPDGWVPEQRITVEEALRSFTVDAAFAEFAEDQKGTIAPGKLADLVLLDRDLRQATPEEIRQAKVRWTMVGGKIVFKE